MGERTYRGFTITRARGTGYWQGYSIVDGYFCQLMADTLAGLKELIRDRLAK